MRKAWTSTGSSTSCLFLLSFLSGYLVGAKDWNANSNEYSTYNLTSNLLPYTLNSDLSPTTFTPLNSNGLYHQDLQQNLSAFWWNNRVDDSYSSYANVSPLSAPVTPGSSISQWSSLSVPDTVFRAGQDWSYTSQSNADFLNGRVGGENGVSLFRTIGGDVVDDSMLGRYYPHYYYNRVNGNGPFRISAVGAVTKIGLTVSRDFKSTFPWFQTNVGGLPTMSINKLNDAHYRAALFDSYLMHYPGAASELTAISQSSVKGADWQNSSSTHQWYQPSGDPIYVRYREGDILTRNGHNTVFTVSRNKQNGVEAVS